MNYNMLQEHVSLLKSLHIKDNYKAKSVFSTQSTNNSNNKSEVAGFALKSKRTLTGYTNSALDTLL